jgi:Na+/H+ antiporter NhaD/arsenite permease-like protein
MTSIIILIIVFLLIAVRQVGNIKLQIWQVMIVGALAVLITRQITFSAAFNAINPDVILFLFGMFVVGEALEKSGYLSFLSYNYFKRAKTTGMLLFFIIFGMGTISMFLMNDTAAIIGTPVVLMFAEKNKIPPKLLLIALAFAITTGSVMSPIGNPQNLLIAVNGNITNVFSSFFKYLFVPTILNLFAAFFLLKLIYKQSFNENVLNHFPAEIRDERLALISKFSLGLILFFVFIKIFTFLFNIPINFKLPYIALAAALPVLIFSKQRVEIISKIDWHTLIFFVAMFILMQSVWNSGIIQNLISKSDLNIASIFMILLVSIVLSQLISNVPLVALYLPILIKSGASPKELMALAAGSTIAGNLFILGAASNIIIIQNAEKKKGETLTFLEFAKIGVPFTIINALIYYIYLKVF